MSPRPLAVLVLAALALVPAAARGQNYVELRGAATADGSYRYGEFNRTFGGTVMADVVYFGVPDSNEIYAGIGRVLKAGPFTLVPLLYGVAGEGGERGVAVGLTVYGEVRGWNTVGFIGHFRPAAGSMPRYTFLDSLDVTRKGQKWEVGGSAGFFQIAGTWNPIAGPVVVRNDARGAWRMSVRGGSHAEARVVRIFNF